MPILLVPLSLISAVPEFSAEVWAVLWLLHFEPCLEYIIHYDHAYPAGVASQCFDVVARPIVGTFLADIPFLLQSRPVATWSHDQGHCGNAWNDASFQNRERTDLSSDVASQICWVIDLLWQGRRQVQGFIPQPIW